MATTTTTTVTSTAATKRHPIRGFLYGIPFGLGLAMIAIGQKWAALGTWPPFIIFIVGIIVSMLWSTFGPAKAPKGAPPVGASDAVDAEVVAAADTVEVTVTETEVSDADSDDSDDSDADGSGTDDLTEGNETD